MSNPFIARRPWAVALITLIFGPFVGMLYLNRGKLALLYLALTLAAVAGALVFLPQMVTGSISPNTLSFFVFPVTLVAAVHAYVVARRRDSSEPLRWYARWYVLLVFVLIGPVVALGVRTTLVQPFNTASASMAPALNSGDYFLVTKFAYDGQEPRRGDVVVFHAVRHGNVSYIKRIIGLPGERIQLKAGIVYIDGIAVPRRRVGNASGPCDVSAPCHEVVYEEALPGGRSDRVLDLSPIEADNTQVFAVPPNAYFVLGDNRDNSLDSRFDEISFVSRGDIIGRADYMYISDGHWTWQPVR